MGASRLQIGQCAQVGQVSIATGTIMIYKFTGRELVGGNPRLIFIPASTNQRAATQ